MLRTIDSVMELSETIESYGVASDGEAQFVLSRLDTGMMLLDRMVRIVVTVHHGAKNCESGRLKPIIPVEDYNEFMDYYREAVIEYNRYRSKLR